MLFMWRVGVCSLVIYLVITIKVTDTKGGSGYCSFPRYLWSQTDLGGSEGGSQEERLWISKTEFIRNTDTWSRQKSIRAKETEIFIQNKMHASCNGLDREGPIPCFRQEVTYSVICVSEEPNNKFRTRQNLNGKFTFSCVRFVQQSPNVVQIYQAVQKDINEDRLCYDVALQRDEWPWLDPIHPPMHRCSFSGGYDFREYHGESRQKRCSNEWRPSRLETECTRDDGIRFRFPSEECSPFDGLIIEQKLSCWSEWIEDSYLFLVLSDPEENLPRYVLRLPTALLNGSQPFLALFYFSTVAPLSGRGNPPGNVMFFEMHVHRSETGICFDESEECPSLVENGRCHSKNNDMYQYTSFCLKSCGMCELAATLRPECRFSSEFAGRWMSFEEGRVSEFIVDAGEIRTSSHGSMICKSKHWELPYYKVLLVNDNGCRPRYCCVHLISIADALHYWITGCSALDESFSNCDLVIEETRSSADINGFGNFRKRTLLPMSSVQLTTCGFIGHYHVRVTWSDKRNCEGRMSDVDEMTCQPTSKLKFDLTKCANTPARLELPCDAFVQLTSGTRMLITRPPDAANNWCWVVKDGDADVKPFAVIRTRKPSVKLQRANCSTGEPITTFTADPREPASIDAFTDHGDPNCDQSSRQMMVPSADHKQSMSGGVRPPALLASTTPDPTLINGQPLHDFDAQWPTRRRKEQYRPQLKERVDDVITGSPGSTRTIRSKLLIMALVFCQLSLL